MSVLIRRALLFGAYTGAPDCWNLPEACCQSCSQILLIGCLELGLMFLFQVFEFDDLKD